MIIFESHKTTYKVDSAAIQRASPVLYERCLAVRPADGFDWTFEHDSKGWPETSKETAEAILHLIHGNEDQVPESLHFETVYNVFTFAIRYELFDRYYNRLKRWCDKIDTSETQTQKTRECYRLWLVHKLHPADSFTLTLQKWAVYNLFDDGKGGLGDPSEELSPGKPLDLAGFSLSDKTVIGKFISFLGGGAVGLL